MDGGWMDAWRMDGGEWLDGQTDGRTDRRMDTGSGGWEGGRLDAQRKDGGEGTEGWEDRGQPLTPLLPQEAREVSGSLRRELGDSESRRAALEQRLEQLSAEAGGCRRAQDEAVREAARLRADIELLRRYPLPVRLSIRGLCPCTPSTCLSPRRVCLSGSERGRVEQALAAEQARAGVLQRSEAELQRRGRGLEEQRDEAARAAEAARQQLEHRWGPPRC